MRAAAVLASASLFLGLTGASANAAGTSCTANAQLASKSLGKFYGFAYDVQTGKSLISANVDEQTPSASVLKVLTGAAATMFLWPNYRATTSVYRSATNPGVIYLVGGGDHTLSAMTGKSYTTYKHPAKLAQLAAKVLKKFSPEQKITKIIVDESFFDENTFNSKWKTSDRINGYNAPISALMVDADRVNGDLTSTNYSGFRYINPAVHAGRMFQIALGAGASKAKVALGVTPSSAESIASVSSQPVSVWIDHALKVSDNTETEIIARHVMKVLGLSTSFASVQPMVETMLDSLGISSKGLVMYDASGLAQDDRVTPRLIVRLLGEAAKGNPQLNGFLDYFATTSSMGTLTSRFKGANAEVAGSLRAKTGFIPGLSSMAGVLTAKDKSVIAFAFFARTVAKENKFIDYNTRASIDSLVARMWQCGARMERN